MVVIKFPSKLREIPDVEKDNTDVFVDFENGYTYNVIVGTPKSLQYIYNE